MIPASVFLTPVLPVLQSCYGNLGNRVKSADSDTTEAVPNIARNVLKKIFGGFKPKSWMASNVQLGPQRTKGWGYWSRHGWECIGEESSKNWVC